jgi:hypothetical protein
MWIKVNFDHLFSSTNYELYVIKIVSLETSFNESNDIIFMIYISFFVDKNWWSMFFLNCVRAL